MAGRRYLHRVAGLMLAIAVAIAGTSAPAYAQAAGLVHQLRIYEIFEGNKAAFHTRFRDHAMRIMAKYDFKIVAMWEAKSEAKTEFVYILQWPDRATLTDRWAKMMADQEWSDIKAATAKAHGKLVGEIQDRVIELTPYSPKLPPR